MDIPLLTDLPRTYKLFLNKTTMIYGRSTTGKSTIILDILFMLKGHANQIVVISPTSDQNGLFTGGVIPKVLIHSSFTPQSLKTIIERQMALSSATAKANDLTVLQRLFMRIGDIKTQTVVNNSKSQMEQLIKDLPANDDPNRTKYIKSMQDNYDEFRLLAYKAAIIDHKDRLLAMKLDEDEKLAITNIQLNPRLVIVFDDCTEMIKKYKNSPELSQFFYTGRWANITAIIACHTDKAFPPELRSSAFLSIFTSRNIVQSYLQHTQEYSREEVRTLTQYSNEIFTDNHPYQKMVCERLTGKVYKYTAQLHDKFSFCPEFVVKYCEMIENKNDTQTAASTNRFYRNFV